VRGNSGAKRSVARFAAQHGEPAVTGSIETKPRYKRALGYSKEDDDGRPEAVPGDD
jgi:hypothetical protein